MDTFENSYKIFLRKKINKWTEIVKWMNENMKAPQNPETLNCSLI